MFVFGLPPLPPLLSLPPLPIPPAALAPLLSLRRHHDDIPDPAFMEWLQARLNHLITWEPWLVAGVLGAVVLAIPAAIIGFYLYQARHSNSGPGPS